tara:strand:+ start:4930 stop:5226 length:297 start_codon:yes stop_codon:yes gene_type:complete
MPDFRQLISCPTPVLIHFFNESYPTVNGLDYILESIANEMGSEVRVLNININKNVILSKVMQIKRVPTIMIYKEESLIWRQSGFMTKDLIINVLRSLS